MEEVKSVIAKNLTSLRKKSGLTQVQLAEKLNYSDKAISKWEKADCVPSVFVLMELADFYGVKLQDIVYEKKQVAPKISVKRLRTMISLLTFASLAVLSTLLFVILSYIPSITRQWLVYILALPVLFFVLTVFAGVWKSRLLCCISCSLFVWTAILAISLFLNSYDMWMVYLIGIPLQILVIFATVFLYLKAKSKV